MYLSYQLNHNFVSSLNFPSVKILAFELDVNKSYFQSFSSLRLIVAEFAIDSIASTNKQTFGSLMYVS